MAEYSNFSPKPQTHLPISVKVPRGGDGGAGGERRDLGVNCTISVRFTFVAYFLLVPHRAVGVYFVAYLYFS